jgi:hypothetical protein
MRKYFIDCSSLKANFRNTVESIRIISSGIVAHAKPLLSGISPTVQSLIILPPLLTPAIIVYIVTATTVGVLLLDELRPLGIRRCRRVDL